MVSATCSTTERICCHNKTTMVDALLKPTTMNTVQEQFLHTHTTHDSEFERHLFHTQCMITNITAPVAAVTRPSITILLTPMQLQIACTMQHCHIRFQYHISTMHQPIRIHQTSYKPTATLTMHSHPCYKHIRYRKDRHKFLQQFTRE